MKNQLTNLKRWLNLILKGLTAALLLLVLSLKGSASFYVPDDKIQLKIENGTIKEALKEIERQCNFTFIYNDANINVNQLISVSCYDKSLRDLLDEILKQRGIRYTFVDNHIVLTNALMQQEKKIVKGNVTDASTGEVLPGVTVLEKGTSNGTVTDINGNFSLTVAESSILQISIVGYQAQEIPVAGREDFSISMELEVVALSEIVVIGYGTVKKSDLTGAVASVSAEDIKQNIGSGIDQALQGRTAGVTVTTNSGSPGQSPTVRIRGMGTITSPDPFFVVDGMPVSAASVGAINPGDIESMEVLKDASAAAIYGARAANGVVLITTRKAKEGKSSISFDIYGGYQTVAKKYDIMSARDWTTLRNEGGQPWVDSSTVHGTDWQDEIFRVAPVANVQLSFLSGSERSNFALVGSYFRQDGIVRGSDYTRYTLRANSTTNLRKWLTVGENIGLSRSTQNLIPEQDEWTSVIVQALTMDPTTPVRDSLENPMGSLNNNIGNPVGSIERNHNVLRTDQLLGNLFVEIKPFPWLSFKSSAGAEINRYENEQFFPIFYESTTINSNTTTLYNGWFKQNTFLFEQLLTFKKSFSNWLDLQVNLGYTRQRSSYRLDLRQTSDVPESEDLWFISNGDATAIQYEDVQGLLPIPAFQGNLVGVPYDASMISYLGRIMVSFLNRYDITASIRRDGSSKFGSENIWGNFPSFAIGWKITEEPWVPKNDVLNFLKLRIGWGQLGNQEIGDYAAYTSVSYGYNYTFGPYGNQQAYPGGTPRGLANQGIKWETTEQGNLGLDASLIRFRLSLNVDGYYRITRDMLAQTPVPGITGIEVAPFVNTGSIRNIGYEVNISYRNQERKFKYLVGFNIGGYKNEVIELGSEQPINSAEFRGSDYIARTEVGHPIGCFYGFVTDGIFQTRAEVDSMDALAQQATGSPRQTYDGRKRAGDIKMKDLDGDFQITDHDRTFIGNPHPKFTYGINVELDYFGFDFKLFGQGVYGNDIFMATVYYLESGDAYWNTLNTMENHWREAGDDTDIPRLVSGSYNADNMRLSDRYVKDGSYFRIKSLQLGYTISFPGLKKIGIEKWRFYVNSQNILSFHKYDGFDPEIGIGRSQGSTVQDRGFLDIGIDRGMYPLAKTYTFGMNLIF
ncbi:MAG: TonB-dependent receptor [Bacteroidales bacterium]|nr:TonB-dependent receptor [Bacteroidales bacterium]